MRVIPDIAASLVVAASAALPMDNLNEWVDLAKTFGVVGAILVYFIVRDYLRYQADQKEKVALNKKLDDLVKGIITDYRKELKDNQEIIVKARETHKILIETYEPTSVEMHDHMVQQDDDSTREIKKSR